MTDITLQTSDTTTIQVENDVLSVIVSPGNGSSPVKTPSYTTGNVTLKPSDIGRSFVSTDATPVNMFLPADMPVGKFRSFQGGSGQITYVATNGATIVDGQLRSSGQYSEGYFVDIESFGNDTYVILGDTTEGVTEWSIVGQQTVREGDASTYVIWRPDTTSQYPSGVTLTVSGSNFGTSGFDQTLEEALANLALLDPGITFDGIDQLTILPAARNPLPIHLFAQPNYTTSSSRTAAITISNPSVGTVSPTASAVTTTILNVSRPTAPVDLFPSSTALVATSASIGANTLTVEDASDITQYSTLTASGIPALTYVESKVGNVLTLSANLSAGIAAGASITVKPPGFHYDFTDSATMTLDGSNRCAQVVDKVHGYPVVQSTLANKPIFNATALNGVGALVFDGTNDYLATTSPAIAKISDMARPKATIIIVGTLNSAPSTKNWCGGRLPIQAHSSSGAFGKGLGYLGELQSSAVVGIPFIWMYEDDGTTDGGQTHCNGQRISIPVTVTSAAAAGQKIVQVDDTSSIKTSMNAITQPYGGLKSPDASTLGAPVGFGVLVSSIDSATQITLNTNLQVPLVVGQTIEIVSATGFNRPVQTGTATTSGFGIGASESGSLPISANIHHFVYVPRILSIQEKRGVHLQFSQQLSTSFNLTTAAISAEGTKKLTLGSVTGVSLYQTVSGTNIKTGSTVVKINTSTKEVWLDEVIQTGGVSNGATITFHNCGIKIPDQIDVGAMVPMYREDFVIGAPLSASGPGFRPYGGDPASPGTFNGAYGAVGHGGSNNGTSELEWYLDVLNWAPWRSYTPFAQYSDSDVPKGGLQITASPTPAEVAPVAGYFPPQPDAYPYISGQLVQRGSGSFSIQYGYWESRIKGSNVIGFWGAFWLLAANGGYPPEIDIWEGYGFSTANTYSTNHLCKTFNLDFTQETVGTPGQILVDFAEEYVLFGVDVTPTTCDFYINREKIYSCNMQWDQHTPWYMLLNLAVQASQGGKAPDRITPMSMFVDYAACWRYPNQVISPTGSTQSETTALVTAMSVAPSGARQTLINTAIEKLKLYQTSFGVSLWSALDILVVPAAHDAQAGRINWKDPSNIGTVVGSPTFTTDRGYSGALATSYISMGTTLSGASSLALNSALNQSHVGAVVASVTRTDAIAIGTSTFNITPKSGNSLGAALWTSAQKTTSTASTGGHYVATRNHFQYTFHQNGALTKGLPTTGSNTHSTDADVLKIANGTSRVALAHAGDYLTPDDVRYLYAVFYEYLHALGAL